jgi:hypothetical protein
MAGIVCTRCSQRIVVAGELQPPVGEELSLHKGVCNNYVGVDRYGLWQSHVKMAETHFHLLNDVFPAVVSDIVLEFLLWEYSVQCAEDSRVTKNAYSFFLTERYLVADEALQLLLGKFHLHPVNYPNYRLYVKRMDPEHYRLNYRKYEKYGSSSCCSEYLPLQNYMFCEDPLHNTSRALVGGRQQFFKMLMEVVVGYEHHHHSRMTVINLWMNHFEWVLQNELSPPYLEVTPHLGHIYVLQQVKISWYALNGNE